VPEESVVHVQIPPARTTLPLRFEHFRSVLLTAPLEPLPADSRDPHATMLAQRPRSKFRVTLHGGEMVLGETIGHVESPYGLFVFPPLDDNGRVTRLFFPVTAYAKFEIGDRIGELLVAQHSATTDQVAEAIDKQLELRNQKIGDILLARKVVTPEQLFEAIDRQAKMPIVRIGEALTSLGMITEAQLKDALSQQQTDRNVPLGELLVRMGVVTREDLQTALSRKMGYPLVDVDAFPIEVAALKQLSHQVAHRLQVLPLLIRDGRIVVALDDPARRRNAVDEAEFFAQLKVVPVLAQCRNIDVTIRREYSRIGDTSGGDTDLGPLDDGETSEGTKVTDQLLETLEKEGQGGGSEEESQIEQSDNSLVRLINNMIVEASREGVSDIHIESYPGKEKVRIRFRKDGVLSTYLELPPSYRAALVARIKIMCDLDISERRKPQDGKINFSKFVTGHRLELRVATIPTNNNLEDVVMRILASAKPMPVDDLGMSDYNLKELKLAVERPYGMVLCVGPTGSGKTTTLHSVLSFINVPERKIWTAEDPVEISQPGLRQVQVNPKIDWTFAKALRAFLRADPDVIMVGEIRDQETAHMAVEASLTGHLVLSTLHTNSAPETVTRLLDMGMDPFNFADSLLAVLAQRLVRRLCKACRVSEPATSVEIDEWLNDYMHSFGHGEPPIKREAVLAGWLTRHAQEGRLMRHHSPGCKRCSDSGYKGRAGLHELMAVSRSIRRQIQTGARAEELQATAMAEGMRTLRQDGIEKMLAGITTMEEVRATSNA
jgi:type II secretory ATPase GspE/PulE/Tfp pilus assembly ATPase PilB-like protein